MTTTLEDLLEPPTVEQVLSKLLGVYQAAGFPVQSWQDGGVERTRLLMVATGIHDLSANRVPSFAAGGLLDYAENLDNGWLQLLAEQNYNLPANEATYTVGDIKLTAATGAGPYNFTVGQLTAVFAATGNRYRNTGSGTIPLSGDVTTEFKAESPGAQYSDPSSSGSISLVSPLPGVTLTNVPDDYSSVTHVGSGTGTLTLGGTPVATHQVVVRIDSTGASGVASWSYSIDGAAYVSAGAVASATDIGGTGIDIDLIDGGSGTSFVYNDTYLFATPGSWITSQGSDEETNAVLAQRCRDRWPSLSAVPTAGFYELLAYSTPDVGSQVTEVKVVTDANINGRVNIIVAGPEGPLPSDVIDAIQEYIAPRVPLTDLPAVQSPVVQSVTIAMNITVLANYLNATTGQAITDAMNNYVHGVGINGTIRIAAIIEKIMEITGVVDIADVTINAADENLVLGTSTVFEIAETPALNIIYTLE